MTRFVVDCGAVLHLVSEGIEVRAEHELLAPTLLRSQTLSALHEAAHRGEIFDVEGTLTAPGFEPFDLGDCFLTDSTTKRIVNPAKAPRRSDWSPILRYDPASASRAFRPRCR